MSDTADGPPPVDWPEESAQRLAKAQRLRELGVDPYPTRYERTHSLGQVAATWGERRIEELEAQAVPVRVAGRVLTRRGHGKALFATLSDGDAGSRSTCAPRTWGSAGTRCSTCWTWATSSAWRAP